MTSPHSEYVSTRTALAQAVEAVRRAPVIGLDTEFISEGAYEPLLCLVQIATEEGIWIIDPLALRDLADLWQALIQPEREVVAVAAREEIRFCLRYAGGAPARVWDAQIAAGLVGEGYPLSHTNLVRKILGVRVGGGESFTDWRRRPLSASQLEYAADDVRHLLELRRKLGEEARERGREGWVEDECSALVQRVVSGEQEERWWRVSGSSGLSRRDLAALREMWRWRDAEARARNLPPRRVLRDELLVEIAKRQPKSASELFALRGLERGSIRDAAPAILAAVERAMKLPASELPASMRRVDPAKVGILSQLLTVATNSLAAQNHVDVALLATTADVQDLIRWRLGLAAAGEEPALLSGWRAELVREPLLGMLDGRCAVRVRDLEDASPLAFEPWPAES